MINLKNIKTVLLLVAIPFFAFGQCPEKVNVLLTIKSEDIGQMQNLAEKLVNCEQLQDSLALLYHSIGVECFYIPDLVKAIEFTKKGLELRVEILDPGDYDLSKSYNNLGVFYKNINDYDVAENYFKKAVGIRQALNSEDMISSLRELANVQSLQGEYDRALQNLDFAIQKAKLFKDTNEVITCYLEYGNILPEKKEYESAVDKLRQAKTILELYPPDEYHAVCYTNLALNYFKLNKYSEAIEYGEKSIALWKAFQEPYELSTSLNNLGLAYLRNNQFRKAKKTLEEGKRVAQKNNIPFCLSQSFDNLAELYLLQNQEEKALQSFHNAVKTLVKDFDETDYFSNPSKAQMLNTSLKKPLLNDLSDKANALFLWYEKSKDTTALTKSLETYKLCDYLIDLLRKQQVEESTKLFWREKVIPVYENAIKICVAANDTESAFFFFEKSKAILLLEGLQNADALAIIPDSIKNISYEFKKQLIAAQEDLEYADEKDRAEFLQQLLEKQKEFDGHNKRLSTEFPAYAAIKFGTDILDITTFKESLYSFGSIRVTGVHYFYGQKNIYALVTKYDSLSIYNLGLTKEIEPEIRKFLSFFEKASLIENNPKEYLDQAYLVYTKLVEPFGLIKGQEMLVFPDGALAYLPFDALSMAPGEDIIAAPYLLKHFYCRYGYSATISTGEDREGWWHEEQDKIAAFAPFADQSSNASYATLDYSADELKQIENEVNGVFLTASKATKASFLKYKNENKVLHLSTHAFSSTTEDKPRIVFADTALYLSDLYTMEIPASLVVLSACQTNIGKLSPGEGVMSLGRGFTYAGAANLVSSLWNVNANSTGVILSDFYKNINNPLPTNFALHNAKLNYLINEEIPSFNRTPYYWAGLVYYGDSYGVRLKPASNYWYVIIPGLVVLLGLGIYFRYK